MPESIKNKVVALLVALCALFFLISIKSCTSASRQRSGREKEMATRLDLEEKISIISRDKAMMEAKLKDKEKELAEETASRQEVQKSLAQEQAINEGLKNDLQKMTALKSSLEEDLKSARPSEKKSRR